MFAVVITEHLVIFKLGPRLRILRRAVLLDFAGFEVLTALVS